MPVRCCVLAVHSAMQNCPQTRQCGCEPRPTHANGCPVDRIGNGALIFGRHPFASTSNEGQLMVSIEDVARRAGVSTATVSRALSGNGPVSAAAREKVAEAASALDYVVSSTASSLASGRTKNVGLMVPYLTRWFFTSVVEGAQQALMRHGYDVT